MGVSVAAIAPRSSVGSFRSICVMYVKCCSLVRYRPNILSGTLLFNGRSLPAAGNLFIYLFITYIQQPNNNVIKTFST